MVDLSACPYVDDTALAAFFGVDGGEDDRTEQLGATANADGEGEGDDDDGAANRDARGGGGRARATVPMVFHALTILLLERLDDHFNGVASLGAALRLGRLPSLTALSVAGCRCLHDDAIAPAGSPTLQRRLVEVQRMISQAKEKTHSDTSVTHRQRFVSRLVRLTPALFSRCNRRPTSRGAIG